MIDITQVRWGIKQLTVYRGMLQDEVVQQFTQLLDLLDREQLYLEKLTEVYAAFSNLLIQRTELSVADLVGDPWQNYLLDKILEEENTFTRKAEKIPFSELGISLIEATKRDLSFLQNCFAIDGARIRELISRRIGREGEKENIFSLGWLELADLRPLKAENNYPQPYYRELKKQKDSFYQAGEWGYLVEQLAAYYFRVGSGKLGRYWAFYWDEGLQGIANPDPIQMENLIGYQEQRAVVIGNTKQFLGGGANNMLLYGDRGTGKSSTIKALVHEYGQLGLRLVEVAKHQMQNFPKIIRELRERPQRFIIFVDDLSFEEDETEYKYLKAVLEGGLEAQPNNVLVYATSNRRHLVRETFRDREKPSEDLHIQDTVQEKLSLSDRFGITVTFTAPSSKEYLSIVEGIAQQKGLTLGKEELHRLALKWELWHNGRSGRTAKQFIEDLLGKMQSEIV